MLIMNIEVQISKENSNKVANTLCYFKHFHDLVYLIILCSGNLQFLLQPNSTHNLERYDLFYCLRNILNWIILSPKKYLQNIFFFCFEFEIVSVSLEDLVLQDAEAVWWTAWLICHFEGS